MENELQTKWMNLRNQLKLLEQPVKWKTFVVNRLSQIQTDPDLSQWEHVPSGSNLADIASQGTLPQDLWEHRTWWEGPTWLREDSSKWPKNKCY